VKRILKKWALRLSATGLLVGGLLFGIVLNPSLLYANRTLVGNYTVYHDSQINEALTLRLNRATKLAKKSELYNSNFKLEICLNDGSYYPILMEILRGKAFAWGFYNKVVLQGDASYKKNYVKLNGYDWNLEQLIAHESIHCYQYDIFGFWHSNPIANYPDWKWEGYPEYIARQSQGQRDLCDNISRFIESQDSDNSSWSIAFSDGTIAPVNYYLDWMLVQYCLEMKQMDYIELLADTTSKEAVKMEMMNWFS